MMLVGNKHDDRFKLLRPVIPHRRPKIFLKALWLGAFEDDIVIAHQHIVMGHIRLKPIALLDQRGTGTQNWMTPIVGKPKQHNLRHAIAFRQPDRVGELGMAFLIRKHMQAMPTVLLDVEGDRFSFFGDIHDGCGLRDRAGLGLILPRFLPDRVPKTVWAIFWPA
jgi:hypothetical protein